MEYTKLQIELQRQPRWKLASCAARGSWVSLAGFCAETENGGIIAGAKAYTDDQWMALVQCRASDIAGAVAAGLLTWDGDNLCVEGYDFHGEAVCKMRRVEAKKGGVASGTARREQRSTWREANASSDSEANASADDEANAKQMLPHKSNMMREPSTSTSNQEEEEEARVRAQEPPPPPIVSKSPSKQKDKFTKLRVAMAGAGFRTDPESVAAMSAYLRDDVRVSSMSEADSFLRWIRGVAKDQGVEMRYARQAGDAAARTWRENYQADWRRNNASKQSRDPPTTPEPRSSIVPISERQQKASA